MCIVCDGLNAFEGIVNAAKEGCSEDFLWGLPTSFLWEALLWGSKSCVRREAMCVLTSSSDGRTTNCCSFPCWSWVGWVGQVNYLMVWKRYSELHLLLHLDLIFYYVDANGLFTGVDQVGSSGTTATQSLVELRVRKDGDTTSITPEDIPECVLASSIASTILFFLVQHCATVC